MIISKCSEKIKRELHHFRSCRPAAIQQRKQLFQSILLALEFKKIDWIKNPEKALSEEAQIQKVVLLGAFDTKGMDYHFVRKEVLSAGFIPICVDFGIFPSKPLFKVEVDLKQILEKKDDAFKASREKRNRPAVVEIMKSYLATEIVSLYNRTRFDAIFSMGGTNGTEIAASAMRELPREVLKVCLSTVTQHGSWAYGQDKDIVFLDSFTDVSGVTQLSSRIYNKAIKALSGMLKKGESLPQQSSKKTIGISMFGNTTECVTLCKEALEKKGYDVAVFHAVGTGGKKLEALVADGTIHAVLDITTHEVADEICGGVFSAGPERLSAPGKRKIPHLIVPGCVDMINFVKFEETRKKYPNRFVYRCNEEVTVMRTNVVENLSVGHFIAKKANIAKAAGGLVAIFVPAQGLSMFEKTVPGWHDPWANSALFHSIAQNLDKEVPLRFINAAINDPLFAKELVESFFLMLESHEPVKKETDLTLEQVREALPKSPEKPKEIHKEEKSLGTQRKFG